MKSVHFMSETNEWPTPDHVFKKLNDEFHFTLDPCSTKENAKCDKYYTKEDDGLSKNWGGETVFMNPPYGRTIKRWMEKAYISSLEGATVVCLIPARTETSYWHKWIFGKCSEIRFINGRIKFGGSKWNAPFPSAVVIYQAGKINSETKVTTQKFEINGQTDLTDFI